MCERISINVVHQHSPCHKEETFHVTNRQQNPCHLQRLYLVCSLYFELHGLTSILKRTWTWNGICMCIEQIYMLYIYSL